jgi:hypothetical protein
MLFVSAHSAGLILGMLVDVLAPPPQPVSSRTRTVAPRKRIPALLIAVSRLCLRPGVSKLT